MVAANGNRFIDANVFRVIRTYRDRFIDTNRFRLIVVYRLIAIILDSNGFVVIDCLRVVVANPFGLVVFDIDRLVFLSVEIEFFRAPFIFKADLIEVVRCTAFGAAALQCALRFFIRQRIRRQVIGVVDAPGHDRPIGIALHKLNHDFLADAWKIKGAPVGTGPGLTHPHPAGARPVVGTMAVPVELHLDAPELIGVNLFTGGSGNDSRLRPLDDGLGR